MKTIVEMIVSEFKKLSFEPIYVAPKSNENGPDMWVQKRNRRPLSVEIKVARRLKEGQWQVPPVEPNRTNDDLIAIALKKYILIEPMKDHLKCVSKKGTRQFTIMN